MAIVTGVGMVGFGTEPASGAAISSNLSAGAWSDQSPPLAAKKSAGALHGSAVDNLPISMLGEAQTGFVAPMFGADYYNRIHITPSTLDVGNIVSEQIKTVEVWNAYTGTKTLNTLSGASSGVILSGITTPSAFLPLESKTLTLTIAAEGDPEINTQYSLAWADSADNAALTVLGIRVISFPYPYSVPASETLEWTTEVSTANDGTEQRRRIRKTPKEQLTAIYPMQLNHAQSMENLLYGWIGKRWAVPVWSEAQQVGVINSTDTVININTSIVGLIAGELIMVWDSAQSNTLAKITIVGIGQVTLSVPIGISFSAAYVMPVKVARIKGAVRKSTDGQKSNFKIKFDFYNSVELSTTPTAQQYKGADIYLDPIYKGSSNLTEEIGTRVDVVDYGTGKGAQTQTPWAHSKHGLPLYYLLEGLQEVWAYREFLHRRAGKLRPFWLPTFESNFSLVQTGLLSSTLIVTINDYVNMAEIGRSHLGVLLLDGTWLLREITSASNIDTTTMTLTVDSPLSVQADTVNTLSFLELRRMDNDKTTLQWGTGQVVKSKIKTITVDG